MFSYVIILVVMRHGRVVQLVRTLACHARGRGFEPHLGRHHAAMAQLVERILGKDEVISSILISSSKRHVVKACFFVLHFMKTVVNYCLACPHPSRLTTCHLPPGEGFEVVCAI